MTMRGVRLTIFLIALLGLAGCRSTGPGTGFDAVGWQAESASVQAFHAANADAAAAAAGVFRAVSAGDGFDVSLTKWFTGFCFTGRWRS